MCESFGRKVSTPASCSPWSNGVVEQHNQTLTNILLKLKEDVNCDWETTLAGPVSPKISMINNNVFSPVQLVLGPNPNLPSIFTTEFPALENKPASAVVGLHISAPHSARMAFVLSESNENIKRALRKETRQETRPSINIYQIVESVFYKREDDQRWKDPTKFLGQDGPFVFLRHGSFIKAHICHVQPAEPETNPAPMNVNDKSVESQVINNEPDNKKNIHNNPDNVTNSDDEDIDCSSDAPEPTDNWHLHLQNNKRHLHL